MQPDVRNTVRVDSMISSTMYAGSVAVIIPVHNGKDYIARAVKSAL
jgi:hypothetical protein